MAASPAPTAFSGTVSRYPVTSHPGGQPSVGSFAATFGHTGAGRCASSRRALLELIDEYNFARYSSTKAWAWGSRHTRRAAAHAGGGHLRRQVGRGQRRVLRA